MTTLIALPIIRTKGDLETALKRLDVIIDAADGSLEADERSGLSDLIAAYEDRFFAVRDEDRFFSVKDEKPPAISAGFFCFKSDHRGHFTFGVSPDQRA